MNLMQWIRQDYPVGFEERGWKEEEQCGQTLFSEGEAIHEAVAGGKSGVEGKLLSLLFQMEILEQCVFQIVGFDSLWGPLNG